MGFTGVMEVSANPFENEMVLGLGGKYRYVSRQSLSFDELLYDVVHFRSYGVDHQGSRSEGGKQIAQAAKDLNGILSIVSEKVKSNRDLSKNEPSKKLNLSWTPLVAVRTRLFAWVCNWSEKLKQLPVTDLVAALPSIFGKALGLAEDQVDERKNKSILLGLSLLVGVASNLMNLLEGGIPELNRRGEELKPRFAVDTTNPISMVIDGGKMKISPHFASLEQPSQISEAFGPKWTSGYQQLERKNIYGENTYGDIISKKNNYRTIRAEDDTHEHVDKDIQFVFADDLEFGLGQKVEKQFESINKSSGD